MGFRNVRLSPIVVFAFKRLNALQQVIESLKSCDEYLDSPMMIFIDGARNPSERLKVDEVIAFCRNVALERSGAKTEIIVRERNLGLKTSIRTGVALACAKHGSAIIIEDDLIVSEQFLTYMNKGLQLYWNQPQVASINAYCYDTMILTPYRFGFMRFTHPWGWATWKDRWDSFEKFWDSSDFKFHDLSEKNRFDLGGVENYSLILRDEVEGRVSSWWIRFHFFAQRQGLLSLFPSSSLVKNIGILDDPTHTSWSARLLENNPQDFTFLPLDYPIEIEEELSFRRAYIFAMKPVRRRVVKFIGRLRHKLRNG